MTTKEDDFVENVVASGSHDFLMMFTNVGKVYTRKAYLIPESSRTAKGTNIVNLVELTEGEILDIMNEIQSSPLVEFINSMMPEEDYTEPEYDWEYDYYAA